MKELRDGFRHDLVKMMDDKEEEMRKMTDKKL